MKTKIIITIISLLLLLPFCRFAVGAYLEGGDVRTYDDNQDEQKYIIPIPPVPPIYPKPRENSFYNFINSLTVDNDPIEYNDLVIYLLKSSDSTYSNSIINLDEAYRSGNVTISEYNDTVSTISVSSFSGSYIFLMAGEIISGGKQTRTILKDILIPPYAKNVTVEVYCIEEGRWYGAKEEFAPAKPMLDSNIRKQVLSKGSQSKIWGEVKEYETRTKQSSDTHSLLESYSKTQNNRELENRVISIKRGLPYKSVGMVVIKNCKIVGIEAFSSHEMFEEQFSKLFSSYYYMSHSFCLMNPSYNAVTRFVKDLLNTSLAEDTGYTGAGRLFNASHSYGSFYGNVLELGDDIVHLSMIN